MRKGDDACPFLFPLFSPDPGAEKFTRLKTPGTKHQTSQGGLEK